MRGKYSTTRVARISSLSRSSNATFASRSSREAIASMQVLSKPTFERIESVGSGLELDVLLVDEVLLDRVGEQPVGIRPVGAISLVEPLNDCGQRLAHGGTRRSPRRAVPVRCRTSRAPGRHCSPRGSGASVESIASEWI